MFDAFALAERVSETNAHAEAIASVELPKAEMT